MAPQPGCSRMWTSRLGDSVKLEGTREGVQDSFYVSISPPTSTPINLPLDTGCYSAIAVFLDITYDSM